MITELNERSFDSALSGRSLVEFYSPDCGYCRISEPVFRRLSERYGDVGFFKLDTRHNESLTERFNISGLPTFVLLENGRELARSAGARGEAALCELLDSEKVH